MKHRSTTRLNDHDECLSAHWNVHRRARKIGPVRYSTGKDESVFIYIDKQKTDAPNEHSELEEWYQRAHPKELVHQPSDSNRLLFSILAKDWYKETALISSLAEKISHPSYLRIIRMGDEAVPLILEEMRKRPAHWFAALDVLVDKEKPAKDAKTLTQAAVAWIKWGEDNGYL